MGYTVKQIAAALGKTPQRINERARKEGWRPDAGRTQGGGREYSPANLPQDVGDAVLKWELKVSAPAIAEPALPPAVKSPADTSQLTTKQRKVMCARLAFVREIERLTAIGMAKGVILDNLVEASSRGVLAPQLLPLVVVANNKSRGERGLSKRSLQRWCSDFTRGGEAALAPVITTKELTVPLWAGDFLARYQRPQKPSVAEAYEEVFGPPHSPTEGAPSIHAVRRWLRTLSVPAREQGRVTGNARLAILPYQRRDTSDLVPGSIYTMDGTTVDMEVLHPQKGRPFKPEVTFVIDVCTREGVGLSIALAESAASTLDALRIACLWGGIPAMVYADNGPGYKNALWTAEGVGMMDRLGITLTNSIPSRPQGKGIMERAVGTLCSMVKKFSSCTHADMDRDAARKVYKLSRQALKKGSNILPTMEDFTRELLARLERYNTSPHRGLPKFFDKEIGKQRHFSPREYRQTFVEKGWEPHTVPAAMRDELFMPGERRKVGRGWVSFFSKRYFSKELEELHGELVDIRYEVLDASKVHIWSVDGVKICTAELEGHSSPYQPKCVLEVAEEKRRKAQIARLGSKILEIEPAAMIAMPERESDAIYSDILITGTPVQALPVSEPEFKPQGRPLFSSSLDHYRWLMENRDQCGEPDEAWLAEYSKTWEYQDMEDRYKFEGIAYSGPIMTQAKEVSL